MDWKEKVVWVVGASSGIGRALAKELGARGCKLIISSRSTAKLQELANEIEGSVCHVVELDLEKVSTLAAITAKAEQLEGRIDIVFLNGGISQRSLVKDTQLSVDRRLMEINYFSYVELTKSLLPGMISRNYGHFAVTSSLSGKFGFKLRSSYAASKHALHGFFESLRLEEEGKGIGVTMICPALIKTEISLNALRGDGTKQESMDAQIANGVSPEFCALNMIAAVEKGKHEVAIGGFERHSVLLSRLFPKFMYRQLRKRDARG